MNHIMFLCASILSITIGGCVSPEQQRTVDSWGRVRSDIGLLKKCGVDSVPASFLEQRLGRPDCIVSGARLEDVVPDAHIREQILESCAYGVAGWSAHDPPPQWAVDMIKECSIWFYDEAWRYRSPAYPASVWGMGQGYTVYWFAVSQLGQVIAAHGGGFPKDIFRSTYRP